MRLLLSVALILSATSTSLADVVHLKTGRTLEGTVTEMTAAEVVLKMSDGNLRVPRKNVRLSER